MVAPAPTVVPPTSPGPALAMHSSRPPTGSPRAAGPGRTLAGGPSPSPRGMPAGAVAAWACLLTGLGALAWVPASLWPKAGLPAWPAVSLGLVAVLMAWGRGGALLRGLGGIAGLLAAAAGATQIAVLWGAAWVLSYM